MKRSSLALVAVSLLAAVGLSLHSQAQTQNQAPSPARSRSDEMVDRWNDIGNKLLETLSKWKATVGWTGTGFCDDSVLQGPTTP